MTASLLRSRADELGLDEEQVSAWEERVDDALVEALLAGLIRYEEALRELAA